MVDRPRAPWIGWLLLAALVVLVASPAAAQDRAELDAAWQYVARGEFQAAIKAFKAIQKRQSTPSFEVALGLAGTYNRASKFRDAADAAEEALELASTPAEEVAAYGQAGLAAYAQGAADRNGLLAAEAALRQVVERDPESMPGVHYLFGTVLLKLERDEEGVAALEAFLERFPESPSAEQAQAYVDDPRRARLDIVPEFEAVTLDGETLTPKSLEGKVVLFEFWGTWCEPCHRAIPILRRLAKKMEKDPFVIVGVASDRDEDMLREFLEKHEITWAQILDDDRSLSFGTFRVASYPTYLLVDHEGVVVFRDSGFSSRKEAEVSTAVRRALRTAKRDLD